MLRARAALLAKIRSFFMNRQIIEVETPALGKSGATEPSLNNLRVQTSTTGDAQSLYLQTSPEFFMKRLLAAGAGPIYQVCKAFRDGESGDLHNLEFTILEWYRPGFDHHRLMDEVDALITAVLGPGTTERLSYTALFESCLGIDVDTVPLCQLRRAVDEEAQSGFGDKLNKDECLDLLVTSAIRRALGERRVFVYDYPASQAALARVRAGTPAVAERFELFVNGVELANGFHELRDAAEQRRRFEAEQTRREVSGQQVPDLDERLLDALEHGLPACAGVAVGIDRLLMLAANETRLSDVLAFPPGRL
jgi:lysyl-tRNA synthetase class 2